MPMEKVIIHEGYYNAFGIITSTFNAASMIEDKKAATSGNVLATSQRLFFARDKGLFASPADLTGEKSMKFRFRGEF